jgi:hypothetical protein
MSNDSISYIKQRMKELGYDHYHMQPLCLKMDEGQQQVRLNAWNEYLFLIGPAVSAEVIIHADTDIYCSSLYCGSMSLPPEFSGQIIIESSSEQDYHLEFIRVTPK